MDGRKTNTATLQVTRWRQDENKSSKHELKTLKKEGITVKRAKNKKILEGMLGFEAHLPNIQADLAYIKSYTGVTMA